MKPEETMARWMTHKKDEWQFKWLLLGQSLFCSGCHMVRTCSFLDVNPERYIYPARRGQNNQLLLPVYYKYKHGFIDEPLYNYITYRKSMSTPDSIREMAMDRIYEYLNLLKYTFTKINLDEDTKEFCMRHLRELEWKNVSAVYCMYGEPFNFLKLYCKLKMYNTKSRKEIKRIIIAFFSVFKKKTQ